jgi:hypothetical protein
VRLTFELFEKDILGYGITYINTSLKLFGQYPFVLEVTKQSTGYIRTAIKIGGWLKVSHSKEAK